MSRTTAYSSSATPRMISPSTNAKAGALINSILMPRSCWCTWMSKSGYRCWAARGSSESLPVVSTASAQRRNSSCRPPLEASRRRAISARERRSKPPRGEIRAFTVGRGATGWAPFSFSSASFMRISCVLRSKKENGRCFHRPSPVAMWPGSELVLERRQDRPAGYAGITLVVVVLLDRRLVERAGPVVHVLADVVRAAGSGRAGAGGLADAGQGRDAGRGEEAVVFDQAPILVEQVADVIDVERDRGLVALEEARQLLADAHVEVVGEDRAHGVGRHHATGGALDLRVRIEPGEEGGFHRRAAREHHVVRAGRHVEQVHEARVAVAVGVVAEHKAVRTARAAFIEQAYLGLVVTEERVLPVHRAGKAVADGVARVVV